MPKLPGVGQKDAVRIFRKLGYVVVREGKHIIMARGADRILVIPRHSPIDALTMGGIAKDAGLTLEDFRALM
jgi:predicted RNA binding protein YcfA (HicA-like mRNA interferase family)